MNLLNAWQQLAILAPGHPATSPAILLLAQLQLHASFIYKKNEWGLHCCLLSNPPTPPTHNHPPVSLMCSSWNVTPVGDPRGVDARQWLDVMNEMASEWIIRRAGWGWGGGRRELVGGGLRREWQLSHMLAAPSTFVILNYYWIVIKLIYDYNTMIITYDDYNVLACLSVF